MPNSSMIDIRKRHVMNISLCGRETEKDRGTVSDINLPWYGLKIVYLGNIRVFCATLPQHNERNNERRLYICSESPGTERARCIVLAVVSKRMDTSRRKGEEGKGRWKLARFKVVG